MTDAVAQEKDRWSRLADDFHAGSDGMLTQLRKVLVDERKSQLVNRIARAWPDLPKHLHSLPTPNECRKCGGDGIANCSNRHCHRVYLLRRSDRGAKKEPEQRNESSNDASRAGHGPIVHAFPRSGSPIRLTMP